MPDLVPVKRALLSVSDKSGIVDFARGLAALGVELISTGGTARTLGDSGLRATPVEALTGFPEMMDGRVKTLHPKVHGGLLALRDNPEHAAALDRHAIAPIDLLCINLYPFEQTIADPACTLETAIENIDIGGPAMLRSAAKNAGFVLVVTEPTSYPRVLELLRANGGASTLALRRELAAAAFALTSRYDTAIAGYLAGAASPGGQSSLPQSLPLALSLVGRLRYGENPHQEAALYVSPVRRASGIPQARRLHGKELSFNNINDAGAALALSGALANVSGRTAACIVKHANPCGAAVASTPFEAVDEAIAGDPVAAYGGICALSARVDLAAAERLCAAGAFFEVVVAPGFTHEALERLQARSAGVRLLSAPREAFEPCGSLDVRSVPGGFLAQTQDTRLAAPEDFRHAAGPAPSAAVLEIARFLEPVCRALMSNAVCIGGGSRGGGALRLFGAGAGQMDRVTASRLAAEKAGELARGAVAYSDAFFPFDDGPRVLIDAGVTCLVHPGGSKRDQDTFALCEQRGVTCLVTGIRHFRH